MSAPWITLLTDYGREDIYVGVLHGVIARGCPEARVIDVTHAVVPGDVVAGALALADALPHLPHGVHVGVVDPGVGGPRRGVALRCEDGRHLVGPDNGLLLLAADRAGGVVTAIDISASPWRADTVAATFHGRDVFAPVAARLAGGEPVDGAGPEIDPASLIELPLPEASVGARGLTAMVTAVDRFGNLALYATPEDAAAAGLELNKPVIINGLAALYANTFADVDFGELVLHPDSTGRLAVAANRSSAAARLGVGAQSAVRVDHE